MRRTPRYPRALPATVALALVATGSEAAPSLPPTLSWLAAPMEASVQLPGTGVQMIEADGQQFFLAGNGRYVLTGPAWDLWHGERLASVAEASALAGRIDLTRLPLDATELGAFRSGAGQGAGQGAAAGPTDREDGAESASSPAPEAPVWVFVDPLCPHCRDLLQTLNTEGIEANVVLLPIGGKASVQAARQIHCAADRAVAWSALLQATSTDLPTPAPDCDTQPLVRALITAQLLGVEQVPLLIAPDGRLHQGVPEQLQAWLAGE
ncbi:thioredoxin fold domain-containing protein [Thiohalocapsa marina]|uniref:Thioredoxin fold domain-containing protein n=1 Tax=Thiohalocapsa marina TaxID=424902 RepID=A0A5M8FVS4_9GAMM|nr:thioredoxin fold domain-containing protein [Thiohalocapsa marina]KAA6187924.1 thioredoxin fold domain-containing protein [Thiohalocapsa marina]